jgi:hypothetical protein
MARISLSKKVRFNIFKRDFFTCQYCGATPPGVVLEVDHIHPVSEGGKNTSDNLITACFDCNRGKGAELLSSVPMSISERGELLAEKLAQVKAYEKLLKTIRKNEDAAIDHVEKAFIYYFEDSGFTERFRQSVREFLKTLNQYELADYMHRAGAKGRGKEDTLKYFCGICWNIIKGKGR